jgi:hypothetical protein
MAIIVPYQQTSDRQVNQFQQALSKALKPVTGSPMANSTILTKVTLTAGSVTQVPTLINRNIQGWYIIRLRANAVVWDSQDANTSSTQTLALNTTANVVVDLVVF